MTKYTISLNTFANLTADKTKKGQYNLHYVMLRRALKMKINTEIPSNNIILQEYT